MLQLWQVGFAVVQNQPLIGSRPGPYATHRLYNVAEIWRDLNLAFKIPSSSLWNMISYWPSSSLCSSVYESACLSWYTSIVRSLNLASINWRQSSMFASSTIFLGALAQLYQPFFFYLGLQFIWQFCQLKHSSSQNFIFGTIFHSWWPKGFAKRAYNTDVVNNIRYLGISLDICKGLTLFGCQWPTPSPTLPSWLT